MAPATQETMAVPVTRETISVPVTQETRGGAGKSGAGAITGCWSGARDISGL